MNNISFQGRSSIIFNPNKYNEAYNSVNRWARNLNPQSKHGIWSGMKFAAEPDANNLTILVRNEREGFSKFIPLNGSCSDVIENLASRVEDFVEKSKSKVTAWILGGDRIEGRNGDNTIEALNKVADVLCDRPDIDTSILVGSKSAKENVVIHPTKNSLELIFKKPQDTDVKDAFDIVELNNTTLN